MTGRQEMQRRLRLANVANSLCVLGGCALILVSVLTIPVGDAPMNSRADNAANLGMIVGCTVGMAVTYAGIFYAGMTLRCPWCGEGLLMLVGGATTILLLPLGGSAIFLLMLLGASTRLNSVRSCPYCAKMLDDEMPAPGKPGKPRKDKFWDDELA